MTHAVHAGSPLPAPSPTVSPSPPPSPPRTPLSGKFFAAYFESWSDRWAASPENSRLSKVAPYVNVVILSFMQPGTEAVRRSLNGCAALSLPPHPNLACRAY